MLRCAQHDNTDCGRRYSCISDVHWEPAPLWLTAVGIAAAVQAVGTAAAQTAVAVRVAQTVAAAHSQGTAAMRETDRLGLGQPDRPGLPWRATG